MGLAAGQQAQQDYQQQAGQRQSQRRRPLRIEASIHVQRWPNIAEDRDGLTLGAQDGFVYLPRPDATQAAQHEARQERQE